MAEPVTSVIAARGGGEGSHLHAAVARPGGGAALRFEVAPRGFWQVNDEGTDELHSPRLYLPLARAGQRRGHALQLRCPPSRHILTSLTILQVNDLGTDELLRLVADGIAQGLALAQGEQAPQTATGDRGEVAAAEVAAGTAGVSTRLVDLFCGAGLFGVSLAATGRFASVLGLELGPDSVRSAGVNAQANGVGALCRFEATDLAFSDKPPAALAAALAPQARSAQGSELVVVIDPPRAGLGGAMRAALRQSSARVLLYVSCDAQTLGRDLADMCGTEGAGPAFRLARATPVDLTPHAARVETVCLLWRPFGA